MCAVDDHSRRHQYPLDILLPNEAFYEASAGALQDAARDRGFYHSLFPSLDLHDPTLR
jgi:hypothetical protein